MTHVKTIERRGFLGVVSTSTLAMLTRADRVRAAQQPRLHRRVVTGVNDAGMSIVTSDGPAPLEGAWGVDVADLWLLNHVPVDLSDSRDPIAGYKKQAWPPAGGVIVRTGTWHPGFSIRIHRSATIDFLFVISGRVELLLDESSVTLGSGDCVVQRGTNHGWRVVGDEPCTWGVVLLAAKS